MLQKKIIVCVKHRTSNHQPSCGAKGSESLAIQIEQWILSTGLNLSVERFKCLGCCDQGINIKLVPDGPFFHGLTLDNLDSVFADLGEFALSSK